MYCISCEGLLIEGAAFCQQCGKHHEANSPTVHSGASGLLRQKEAIRLLACLVGILILCALAACGSGSPVNPVNSGTPTLEEQVPEPIASYPAALQTGLVPGAVLTFGPTLPPATVHARATEVAATVARVAGARATASMVQATRQAVGLATYFANQTVTSIASGPQMATREAAKTQAVRATQTAFAAQTGPGATAMPPGEWGGVGIQVHVLTDTVRVGFRCDDGTTFVPLTLDASGVFNLPGAYTSCPAMCLSEVSAHFQGQVTGSRLTLTVLWSADGQLNTSGPFTATLGQKPQIEGGCPKCLAGNTLIDTPNGPVPVKDLHEGMLVWTESSDAGPSGTSGARQIATVLKTSRTKVPASHEMVHLVLADGRKLLASPGHPMADGRPLGTLSTGDLINSMRVVSAERVPYEEDYTYDILPSGGTGNYWANGILIGSTLAGPATSP